MSAAIPMSHLAALLKVAEAARVYVREFDHLIGYDEEHDYPERGALHRALDAYDSLAAGEEDRS